MVGSGTTESAYKVAKRFLDQWPDIESSSCPPIQSQSKSRPTHDSAIVSSLGDVGAIIPGSSTDAVDPFVSIVRTLGLMSCPVVELCKLIRSNPATGGGRIHTLVRRRGIGGVRHEFILLRVRIPKMTDVLIRLERRASARVVLFYDAKTGFLANDNSLGKGV